MISPCGRLGGPYMFFFIIIGVYVRVLYWPMTQGFRLCYVYCERILHMCPMCKKLCTCVLCANSCAQVSYMQNFVHMCPM